VGIAMGIRGTDVAKEAADIVLLDDNLQSVVTGIEQGRLCGENLRKSILYTLCSKVTQTLPTFVALLGVPLALTSEQVLLIDVGTDIWTAIAFGWQPAESALMENKPRNPRTDKMVNMNILGMSYGYFGAVQAVVCWCCFFTVPGMTEISSRHENVAEYSDVDVDRVQAGRAMYYWALVLCQVGVGIAVTTKRQSLFKYGMPNHVLNICIVAEVAFALMSMFCPDLRVAFGLSQLTTHQLLIGAIGLPIFVALEEVRKGIFRSQEDGASSAAAPQESAAS